MKKLFCVLLSLMMILVLSGCNSEPVPSIKFTNNLDQTWDNMYISLSTSDDWGESVLLTQVDPGHTVTISMSKFSEESAPGVFDIGVICHNNMNYDAYEVYLADGYELEMSSTGNAEGDTVYLKVKDTEGKIKTYEGIVYPNE
ncbi:MAG: hypothetical protein IJM83_07715 [Firmicutes bacterium]|nr:hypothetical protein [Bacillota bacterium]